MNAMIVGLFVVFWIMQVAASMLFKYGSGAPDRWMLCFVFANIIGISSTWLLMMLYRQMQVNVAMGLAMGLAFLFSQVAVAMAFQSSLTVLQYGGIIGITGGMLLLCMGGRG